MITKALKANFEKYCAAHGLRTTYDALPNCARILKRKGVFILEVLLVSNCKYVPGRAGYQYPIIGATEAEMNEFLAGALETSPKISFKIKDGVFVKRV